MPAPAGEFLLAWNMIVLRERETGKRRVINAPFSFAKVAAAADASLHKGENRNVLEPFQVAFGVQGGPQSMVHLRRLMEDRAPEGAFAVKIDWEKWYYSVNRFSVIDALAKNGMWSQLKAFLAAFGGRGQGRIVFRDEAGKRVVFEAADNGLPPGHPLSGSACSLPVVEAWKEARRIVQSDLLAIAGSPPPNSAAYNEVIDAFESGCAVNFFADDGLFFGILSRVCSYHFSA